MARADLLDLAGELGGLLGRVVGTWSCGSIVRDPDEHPSGSRAVVSEVAGHLQAWVYSGDYKLRVAVRCAESLEAVEPYKPMLRKLVSVFDHDLLIVGDSLEAKEVWGELSATRFLRAAARLSNISTEHLLRRMRVFEAASRQTYEGSSFAGSIVMAHSLTTFKSHAGDRFRAFKTGMSFEDALLHQKWLTPFLASGDFALVTTSYRATVRGFTDVTRAWPHPTAAAPAEEMEGLYGYLVPGSAVLSVSTAGDIYFALPSGVAFVNSKGRWRYQDWSPLRAILMKRLPPEAADQVIRLVRGSSYEHRGALYVILNRGANILDVIPDHGRDGRPTQALRATVLRMKLDATSMKTVLVASRIDGAVVIDARGRVRDVAAMVTEPTMEAARDAGQAHLRRFPGARSTAAWNASIHGLAIKVSDDGPVDVYEAGSLIFHAG